MLYEIGESPSYFGSPFFDSAGIPARPLRISVQILQNIPLIDTKTDVARKEEKKYIFSSRLESFVLIEWSFHGEVMEDPPGREPSCN